MASLGWFVINGTLQEFFAEGSASVLAATGASLSQISAQQQAAAGTAELPVLVEAAAAAGVDLIPGAPPGSASWVPNGQYAGLSTDGQVVIIFDPAIGANRYFRYTGEEIGVPALPAPEAVPPLASGGTRPTNPVAFPPFIGGISGRVVFTEIRNRQSGGVRFGTLPQVVWGEKR